MIKNSEIIKSASRYKSDKFIDDALIPYFDQDGKWMGDQRGWRRNTWLTTLMQMKGAYLPANRRTSRCRSGTKLLTSFRWKYPEAVLLKYVSVGGCIHIPSNCVIRAPSLREIGRAFYTKTRKLVDLPNLTQVGGNFDVPRSYHLRARRLRHVAGNLCVYNIIPESIEVVEGRFRVMWAFAFSAQCLQRVGGSLVPHKSTEINAPCLSHVGGSIIATHPNDRLYLPKLVSVGRDLVAYSTNVIHAPVLKRVGGMIESHVAKDFYNGFIEVGDRWIANPEAVKSWNYKMMLRQAIQHHLIDIEI